MKNSQEYASGTFQKWDSVNWNSAEKKVRTLQTRIVKAYKAKQYRKVRSLQWILTRSYDAKLMAVKRVTSNRGSKTPGVDGAVWSTDKSKMKAIMSLKRKAYKPLPLRRIYIPKSNGKQRPLSIPTMKDRAMQALYLMALDPIAETQADTNSYGFRPKRSCADAIEQCFNTLASKASAQWVLDADIKGCFDNISHEWLLGNVLMDKRILSKWLYAKIIDGKSFFHFDKGTPQGGIISPALANIVLNGMEEVLSKVARKTFDKNGHTFRNKFKVNFVRYADDFIVTANSKEFLEEKIVPALEVFLHERGLSLSKEKTKIVHIDKGFDFLGQNVRKYKGKLLIMPSKGNIKAFKEKIKIIISKNKAQAQNVLIGQLNPVIRGWANYHRHVVSKKRFNDVDNFIFSTVWSWSCRRHSRKGSWWVKKRYFHTVDKDHWTFCCIKNNVVTTKLLKAQSIPIKRHIKIKGAANPYDPLWFMYFKSRGNVLKKSPGQYSLF